MRASRLRDAVLDRVGFVKRRLGDPSTSVGAKGFLRAELATLKWLLERSGRLDRLEGTSVTPVVEFPSDTIDLGGEA